MKEEENDFRPAAIHRCSRAFFSALSKANAAEKACRRLPMPLHSHHACFCFIHIYRVSIFKKVLAGLAHTSPSLTNFHFDLRGWGQRCSPMISIRILVHRCGARPHAWQGSAFLGIWLLRYNFLRPLAYAAAWISIFWYEISADRRTMICKPPPLCAEIKSTLKSTLSFLRYAHAYLLFDTPIIACFLL